MAFDSFIRFDNIKKSFPAKSGNVAVLDGISFELHRRECVSIFGPNGCGKSTLMLMLAGLMKPDSGHIEGTDKIKGKTGFVFQDYRRHLLPWLNVKENIVFPLRLKNIRESEINRKLDDVINLTESKIDILQSVLTLSGGQAQLVSIMRALIIEPELLILDEPFSAIDFSATLSLRQTIINVAHKKNLTVLLISHDLEEAVYMGHRVLFFSKKPSKIINSLDTSFAWPREISVLGTPEFAAHKAVALKIFMGST